MEFAPAFLIGCAGVSAAWLVRRRWVHARQEMAHDFYVAAHALFEDGTFEARLMAEDDGTIVAVNESAADLFRYGASDLTGQKVQKLFFLAEPDASLESLAQRYRHQQELYRTCLEMEGQRKDGTVFPMELRFSDIRLGKDMFILITARDLTQTRLNKQWERELELASGTLQFVGYPIFVLDAEGRIVKHNAALEDYTGYSTGELRNALYWDLLLSPHTRNKASAKIWDLLLQGESHSEDATWKLKDGDEADVVLVMRRLEASGGSSHFAVIAAMPAASASKPAAVTELFPVSETGDVSEAELLSAPEPAFLTQAAPEPAAVPEPVAVEAVALAEAAAPEAQPEPEPQPPPQAEPSPAPELVARKVPPFPMPGLPLPDHSRDEYPPLRPFEPADFIIPIMDRPGPMIARKDPPKRVTADEARQMEVDYLALAEEFAIPERQSPVFREMNLNDLIRQHKPGLARMMGGRVRLTTTLDLGLETVLGDPALIDEVCLTLAWIARHGMAAGGKVSLATTSVALERAEARSMAGLRGGAYGILTFRYQPSAEDSELHALLFTPFHESSAGATLQATLPGLHALLRANGANLLVESGADDEVTVKVFLPMARQNVRTGRDSMYN